MRRFLTTACLVNLMFIAGLSAQTVKPHAEHHPAETQKQKPSAAAGVKHDCPMMKDEGGPMMRPDGAAAPTGQAHRMPDGKLGFEEPSLNGENPSLMLSLFRV